MSEVGIKRECREGPDYTDYSFLNTVLTCLNPVIFCFQRLFNFLGTSLCEQNFAGGNLKGVWFRQLPAIG